MNPEREIVEKLKLTPKYGVLCEETLLRMASWAASRHKSQADAVKAAKRKLHQVYGAYLEACDFRKVATIVRAMPQHAPDDAVRDACREVLYYHASTREREPFIERIFPEILNEIGPVRSIIDLACGLGPFMLPWMAPSLRIEYHPYDIDTRMVALINEFLARIGRPPTAQCCDLLVSMPPRTADVALLLKSLPCLEQQERDAGLRLLPQIPARYIVASFPARSLGAREKGMVQHYDAYLRDLADTLNYSLWQRQFPSESFYILEKPSDSAGDPGMARR